MTLLTFLNTIFWVYNGMDFEHFSCLDIKRVVSCFTLKLITLCVFCFFLLPVLVLFHTFASVCVCFTCAQFSPPPLCMFVFFVS